MKCLLLQSFLFLKCLHLWTTKSTPEGDLQNILDILDIREIHKVRKTQHQNPEFSPNQVRFLENLQKSTFAFKGGGKGVKLRKEPFLVVNWVSSCFDPLIWGKILGWTCNHPVCVCVAWSQLKTRLMSYQFFSLTCYTLLSFLMILFELAIKGRAIRQWVAWFSSIWERVL